MNWFVTAVKKYAVFRGRAGRPEYWYFILIYFVCVIGLSLLDSMMGTYSSEDGLGVFSGIFMLALLLPSLAVGVRRLHDTDRTGWWLLITVIPIIGAIVLLVFTVQRGTEGLNRYGDGPDPER